MELLVNLTMVITMVTLLANSASDLIRNPVHAGAA
jgi:hypothetical protein